MQTFTITHFSGDTRYGQAVARVRVLETRLLPRHVFVRMAEAPGWETMLEALRGQSWAEPLAHVRQADQLETALTEIERQRCGLIRTLALPPRLIDAMASRNDFNTLKVVLKRHLMQTPARLPLGGGEGMDAEQIRERIEARRPLPAPLERARAAAVADYERHHSLFRLDAAIDRTFQEHVRDAFEDSDMPFLAYLVRYWIDLTNVSMALRWRSWSAHRPPEEGRPPRIDGACFTSGGFVGKDTLTTLTEEPRERLAGLLRHTPYSGLFNEAMEAYQHDGALWPLEKLSDDFLSAFCRLTHYTPFGAEPLVAFAWFSMQEMKNLATVATAKLAALRPDVVIPRLRSGYDA